MPVRGASAKRYAQAVFEIAVEHDTFDAWERDLADLAEALAEPQLAALLGNPRIPVPAKRQMLRDAMREAADVAINLATLLIVKSETPNRRASQAYLPGLDSCRFRISLTSSDVSFASGCRSPQHIVPCCLLRLLFSALVSHSKFSIRLSNRSLLRCED